VRLVGYLKRKKEKKTEVRLVRIKFFRVF
jgi:hypothetical protein